MFALIRELVRPYTGWLVIVLIAMLIETAMSLAVPVAAQSGHRQRAWIAPAAGLVAWS